LRVARARRRGLLRSFLRTKCFWGAPPVAFAVQSCARCAALRAVPLALEPGDGPAQLPGHTRRRRRRSARCLFHILLFTVSFFNLDSARPLARSPASCRVSAVVRAVCAVVVAETALAGGVLVRRRSNPAPQPTNDNESPARIVWKGRPCTSGTSADVSASVPPVPVTARWVRACVCAVRVR
jgi:hypothetical protein